MLATSLELIPYKKPPFTIELREDDGRQDGAEENLAHAAGSVFSDCSYEFILSCADIAAVQDVRVYINDTYEPAEYNREEGRIRFPAKGMKGRRIFLDCYGFVQLQFVLILDDGIQRSLCSEYLSVLVRQGELNESVKAMAQYVYDHQDVLLINGDPRPKDLAGLKESEYKTLAAQLILAEEIAAVYETSYGYFKANSRFQIEKVATIVCLEQVQYMTPATLAYIASHPEQLKPVNNSAGVRVGNRVYQPQKTLSLQNRNSYDIYENRVVLGFLQKMIDDVAGLRERCKQLLKGIPRTEKYDADYIYSSYFMFTQTRKMLEDGMAQLSRLYDKFTRLWGMYRNALMIPPETLAGKPRPTAVFLSVPQYNKIFVRIHQWFDFGVYDFAKELFMLSFIKISSLYESYLLAKMIVYLQARGYTLDDSQPYSYPVNKKWKYKNTRCKNTFYFSGGQKEMTLYYQPVIFDTEPKNDNGIGLYRNNSIPAYAGEENDTYRGGHYYAPDYLIKISANDMAEYLILDAKFSDAENVRKRCVKDLAFKYLFSISPVSDADKVVGLCILYGKCTESDQLQSAYDKQRSGNTIVPFTELLPLMEGVCTQGQYGKLDSLLRKVLGK